MLSTIRTARVASACCGRAGHQQHTVTTGFRPHHRPDSPLIHRGSTYPKRGLFTAYSGSLAAPPAALLPEPWTGAPNQLQALEVLRRRMASSSVGCPDDATLQWFLRDRRFDVDEAAVKLTKTLRWRQEYIPTQLTLDMVQRELASGKALVHSHLDLYGRPVVLVKAKLHVTGQYASADSKRLCVYLIDQAIKALPEDKEQILGIFDLRGFSVENADFDYARFMVEAFFEFYPRRVSQVLFVEAPWMFRPAWEAIRPLMRKYAALVRFVSTQELRTEYFTPQTVPPGFDR